MLKLSNNQKYRKSIKHISKLEISFIKVVIALRENLSKSLIVPRDSYLHDDYITKKPFIFIEYEVTFKAIYDQKGNISFTLVMSAVSNHQFDSKYPLQKLTEVQTFCRTYTFQPVHRLCRNTEN